MLVYSAVLLGSHLFRTSCLSSTCQYSKLAAVIIPWPVMPKALAKTKHGQKATGQEQLYTVPGDSSSKPAQGGDTSRGPPAARTPTLTEKSANISASLWVEKCWDKVLQKLCDKASSHCPLPPVYSADVVSSVMAVTGPVLMPHQVSLQDCPVAIQASDLWGLSPLWFLQWSPRWYTLRPTWDLHRLHLLLLSELLQKPAWPGTKFTVVCSPKISSK